jgi:hypothetical protein
MPHAPRGTTPEAVRASQAATPAPVTQATPSLGAPVGIVRNAARLRAGVGNQAVLRLQQSLGAGVGGTVQRKCSACDEDDAQVQRAADGDAGPAGKRSLPSISERDAS